MRKRVIRLACFFLVCSLFGGLTSDASQAQPITWAGSDGWYVGGTGRCNAGWTSECLGFDSIRYVYPAGSTNRTTDIDELIIATFK